ncbi:MAG: glycosyltransferase family 39 protein [Chloroflexota bacterium]|nr:glycosyltransferase family 39 protein [Chloroflexota bacterium]
MKISHSRLALAILLLVYMSQATLYAFFTPAWESPDEPSHYLYTAYLAQYGRPPGPSPIKQTGPFYTGGFATSMYEWYHPALGYLWQALAWRLIYGHDPSLLPAEFPAINPLFPYGPFHYPNLFLPDRVTPIRPMHTDIGLILLRLASALLGIPLIWVVYRAASIVLPTSGGMAVTAAGLVALIPQFSFISGTIRNDTANNLLTALSILIMLRLLSSPSHHPARLGFVTGSLLGITLLTKATSAFLLPVVVLALWLSPYSLRQRIRMGLWIVIPLALVLVCYFLVFPEARLALGYSLSHAKIKPELLNLSYLLSIPKPLRDMFWARFGWANVYVPNAWISIATTLSLVGLGITLIYWAYARYKGTLSAIVHRQLIFLCLTTLSNVAVILRYNLYVYQPQGRFLFPSLVPLSILTLWGAWQVFKPPVRELLAATILGAMLIFNNVALADHLIPAYYHATLPSAYQGESIDPMGEVTDTITVGQTFVARYPNLSRIEILLSTSGTLPSPLTLHLRGGPREGKDLAISTITTQPIQDREHYSFSFPSIADSAGRTFYFFLELPAAPNGCITVWGDKGDVYREGTLFLDHRPASGDLYFIAYSPLSTAPSR